jgi:hypothetical protein
MSGGGGGNGNGGGDMQVSGAEAAYSQEKGISTAADTRVSQTSFSPGGEGQGQAVDRGGVHDTGPALGPDTSTQAIAVGGMDAGKARDFTESELEKGITEQGQVIDETTYQLKDVLRPGKREDQTDTSYDIEKGFLEQKFDKEGPVTDDQGNPVLVEGRNIRDPETGEGRKDLTFAEHWANAPNALKYSPTLRLLWATGANLGEWSKRQGTDIWDWGTGESNISSAPDNGGGGNGAGGDGTVSAAQSNYITSGQTSSSNSVAANWYQSLGSSNTFVSGQSGAFNLASEYAAAKTAVSNRLKTPSELGLLAVNDSPFYNWLKTNSLDKGII